MRDVYELVAEYRADKADAAKRVVVSMFDDVTDRRGWRQAFDGFDPEIRVEIVETWLQLVRAALQPERKEP